MTVVDTALTGINCAQTGDRQPALSGPPWHAMSTWGPQDTPITAKGQSGTVTFDGRFVTISRTGFLARATVGKGEKRIPLEQITAVQWKPAGAVVNGYIQFTIAGGNERRSQFGRQTFDAGKDENSVVFWTRQQPAFERLRAAIESAQRRPTGPPPGYGAPSPDLAGQLGQLAQLYQSGALNQVEYEQAKARLLGG